MSDPTRYRIADNQVQRVYGGNILAVDPAGPLVEYADYARLRMERIHDLNQIGGLQEDYARLLADHNKTEEHNMALCERLQDLNGELFNASCANANMHKENARLKAEVERLRKAGDALYKNQLEGMQIVGWEVEDCPLMMAWNAAKEGKQS